MTAACANFSPATNCWRPRPFAPPRRPNFRAASARSRWGPTNLRSGFERSADADFSLYRARHFHPSAPSDGQGVCALSDVLVGLLGGPSAGPAAAWAGDAGAGGIHRRVAELLSPAMALHTRDPDHHAGLDGLLSPGAGADKSPADPSEPRVARFRAGARPEAGRVARDLGAVSLDHQGRGIHRRAGAPGRALPRRFCDHAFVSPGPALHRFRAHRGAGAEPPRL